MPAVNEILIESLRESDEVAVLVTDAQGLVTWSNRGFEALAGYTTEEMLGHRPGAMLQYEGTDPATVNHLRRHIRSGLPVSVEIENRRKDRSLYWARIQMVPSRGERGQLNGFISIQTDVTAEVVRRRESERSKDALLSVFSHEVRTPLNALVNVIDVLRTTPLDAQQQEWLGYANDAAEGLLRLVNEVLDLARSGHVAMSVRPAPVELPALMGRLRAVGQGYRRAPGVTLHFELPPALPRVLLDEDKVFRTLLNLIGNALKFTEVGRVIVRLEHDPTASGGGQHLLRFSVVDTGIGIAPQDQVRILEPFEQADQGAARRYEGTGLGLALCERMLRVLGSRLQLHSTPGEGSCFWFELMAEAAPVAAAAPIEAMAGEPLKGLRLVVVDDNPLGRLVAEKQIQRLGAAVVVCDSAESLLEHLADLGPGGAPDAVLMDLHMPDVDGLEATRRLRQVPGCAGLPVFALSGAVTPSEIAAAHEVGMLDFIAKPFRAAELARAVLKGLRRRVVAG